MNRRDLFAAVAATGIAPAIPVGQLYRYDLNGVKPLAEHDFETFVTLRSPKGEPVLAAPVIARYKPDNLGPAWFAEPDEIFIKAGDVGEIAPFDHMTIPLPPRVADFWRDLGLEPPAFMEIWRNPSPLIVGRNDLGILFDPVLFSLKLG